MTGSAAAQAQLPWSDDTHQIAFGDFNGDGKTDLLYVAKSSGANSGIALSNNAGPYNVAQTWSSNYLGIAWHSSTYIPIVGDFNDWDARATPMQRSGSGGVWSVVVPLEPGRHVYAFVVDGKQWVADVDAPRAPENEFGIPKSIVMVGGSS